jgi:hypothetical protein
MKSESTREPPVLADFVLTQFILIEAGLGLAIFHLVPQRAIARQEDRRGTGEADS